MKRVLNLYRVSTKGQVDHDDIPMQRIACREFAEKQGWTVVDEVNEKGVSGYKNLAADRDVLAGILQDAKEGKFDILLVFMLDRLGRKSFDTPGVVIELASYGVEVWSAQEGHICCATPEDQVTLFLKCWGAEGESRKTSIRVKERFHQLVEQGLWPGGVVPLGYRAAYKGRMNKKNQPIKDLEIDPREAEIVRELFHKTVHEGYGSHMLAAMLNERGLHTHNGARFQSNTVLRVLRNPIYTGFLTAGETVSPHLPDLQIVEQPIFLRANEILEQRKPINEKKRQVAMTNKGKVLLSGNVYCAHCGTRLASIRYTDSYIRKDGSKYFVEEPKYQCYHRARRLNDCDGANNYKASKVDAVVTEVAREVLMQIQDTPKDISIETRLDRQIQNTTQVKKQLERQVAEKQQEQETLQGEIGKCLLGKSRFTEDVLSAEIDRTKAELDALKLELQVAKDELDNQQKTREGISGVYDRFISWADEFDQAPLMRKKVIVNELFERVTVGKGYVMNVKLNPEYAQFLPSAAELQEVG
ncbi:recombinase family protein [Ruminococcaceae bacterium OttesenSCG-928-A16]|nr:recombinase family protein [Ruminococcaceae bacterium OttesenSCG-928-A16]